MSRVEVEALIGHYFDALYHADADLMARVMHPEAIYATADEAVPLIRRMESYFEVLRQREPPAARGEARTDEIVSLELAGDNTAMARVRCSIGARAFTDFLSIIRDGGQWRIMAKVFAIHPKPQET